MARTPVIDYWCHGYATGYGVAGQRLVGALLDRGVTVQWTPIDFDPVRPWFRAGRASHGGLDAHRSLGVEPDVVVVHATPEVLPAALSTRRDAALVCHTVWETDRIQDHWPGLLNECDLVVVPTDWNAEVFRDGGVTAPIGVVPHVRRPLDVEPDTGWLDHLGDRFVVYTVAAWSPRKAPWRTVECVARAFGGCDDVALVVKSGAEVDADAVDHTLPAPIRHHTWAALARTLGRLGPTPAVHLVDRFLTDAEVVGLHQRGDCWLSLPHAEGWDLGSFDAALSGTPVITTGWGAPVRYLDPSASWLVPAEVVPTQVADLPPDRRARWAAPDLDVAVEMLREVRADPDGARRRAVAQVGRLAATFAPEVVAARFLQVLDQHLGI